MKLGVIVGRFQVPELTHGHLKLIEHVRANSDETLIVVGNAHTKLTSKNPLPLQVRLELLAKNYIERGWKDTPITYIHDNKTNEDWSQNLDEIINTYSENHQNITLYGGRDSFIKYYTGKHKTQEVTFDIDDINASAHRAEIHKTIKTDRLFCEGIIHASGNRYPISYQTVDIAVIREMTEFDRESLKQTKNIQILLCRKSNEKLWRFIGGFVDPTDKSLEAAARRELMEECGPIEVSNFKYAGSFRIDDWRYRDAEDKILTALFTCQYSYGEPKANDDIAEVKWFYLLQGAAPKSGDGRIDVSDIEPEHRPLFLKIFNQYI